MMRRIPVFRQILLGAGVVVLLSAACYLVLPYLDYRIVALVLLLAVSLLAVLFDILPVLVSAVLSALILNLFFIEPVFHYKINSPENALLFFIYILVALVNAVLTNRLRKQEARARDREENEKAIRLYNTLLSSLSHELKTPIATVIGATDTLKEAGDRITPKQKEDLLTAIDLAANRLNHHVENLLNMSRLETGTLKLKKDWCDVNELIFRVLGAVPDLGGHRVFFESDDGVPLFKIDEGLMEVVVYGLLSNAMRHTPPGAEIRIGVEYDDDRLHVVVSDNGRGIPVENRQQVFEKFYRLPQSGTGGTGLGLSIVRGIVEAHQGEIRVTDSASGGAEFSVVLPAEVSYLKNLKNE